MKNQMKENEVLEMFGKGFDCSQIVLGTVSEKIGLTKSDALKIASAFGGGMWKGETCGAVVGALMAIGMKFGQDSENASKQKNNMLAKKAEFESKFSALQGSCICREILGHDLGTKDGMEQIQSKNLLATKCPKVVLDAISALEETL